MMDLSLRIGLLCFLGSPVAPRVDHLYMRCVIYFKLLIRRTTFFGVTKISLSVLLGVLFIVLSIETVVEILSSSRYEHSNDVS